MSDTPALAISKLQRISKDVEMGKVKEALSKIDHLKLNCPICEDYLLASKEILTEAVNVCRLPPDGDNTCEELKEGAIGVIDFLVGVYTDVLENPDGEDT